MSTSLIRFEGYKYKRRRGFTLIEMMVVLMIMGLFMGLVSAITRPDDRAVLRLEAERLSQLLDFAAAEAQLTGKPIAWTADASGYQFWRAVEDTNWSEIRDSELLRARALPPGVAIAAFRVESMRPQGAMRLEFAPEGSSLAFTIGLSLGTERYLVTGSPVGDVRALPDDGNSNSGMGTLLPGQGNGNGGMSTLPPGQGNGNGGMVRR
jgi:general secretion pathway protein H